MGQRMTGTIVAMLFAACVARANGQNEAEEKFKQMEEAISAAETLQFQIHGEVKLKKVVPYSGSAVFDNQNRFHIELLEKAEYTENEIKMISDGKKQHFFQTLNGAAKVFPVPDAMGKFLLGLFARGGAYAGALCMGGFFLKEEYWSQETWTLPEAPPEAKEFQLGAEEEVDGRACQTVSFAIGATGLSSDHKVTIWIDTETNLPAKVHVKFSFWGQEAETTETWTEMKVDEEVEDATFALPAPK